MIVIPYVTKICPCQYSQEVNNQKLKYSLMVACLERRATTLAEWREDKPAQCTGAHRTMCLPRRSGGPEAKIKPPNAALQDAINSPSQRAKQLKYHAVK